MRNSSGFVCASALALLSLTGCGDTNVTVYCGEQGTGGTQPQPTGVVCQGTVCPCSEEGVRAAIAQGGGPYSFDCVGATTIVTDATSTAPMEPTWPS